MNRPTTTVSVKFVPKRQTKLSAIGQHPQQMDDNSDLSNVPGHSGAQFATINDIQMQNITNTETNSEEFSSRLKAQSSIPSEIKSVQVKTFIFMPI